MSVGIAEIIEFYDGRLSSMMKNHSVRNTRLNRALACLDNIVKPGMTVLDIGCGTGITSRHLASVGARVTAVDISPKLIEYAREHSYHPDINYINCDVCEFQSDQKFDIISLVDVVEHIMPVKLPTLIEGLVANNAHRDTLIYLNVPDSNFISFMINNYPDKLQIIDEECSVEYLVGLFSGLDFSPAHMEVYGIDTGFQYNEYVFVSRMFLKNHYGCQLSKIYNTNKGG